MQSIGYEEAEVILHSISPENEAPSSWEGKLEAPYNLGPNLRYPGWKVRVDVSVTNQMRVIYNTIGILRGSIEKGQNTFQNLNLKQRLHGKYLNINRSLRSFGQPP